MNLLLSTIMGTLVCVKLERVTFDNFSIIQIKPTDTKALDILKKLQKNEFNNKYYDFWTSPSNLENDVEILVSPVKMDETKEIFQEYDIVYKILTENIQEKIDKESLKHVKKNTIFGWQNYQTLDEIYEWLRELSKEYPQVKLIVGGKSYEHRVILGVKVSFGPDNANRSILIDSLFHGREWISGTTSTYILHEILTSNKPNIRYMAEKHDWYIFPVINPDGYEYSHNDNRLWVKNRKPSGFCVGTDLNQNWDFKWKQNEIEDNPCSDFYSGPFPSSEYEVQSLGAYLRTIGHSLVLYISFHSYGQMILLPSGYTTSHLSNYDTVNVALKAAEAISRYHYTRYKVGNIAEHSLTFSGSSIDWVKVNFDVPYVYLIQLPDKGEHGYLVPSADIIPIGEETLRGVMTIVNEIDVIYKKRFKYS